MEIKSNIEIATLHFVLILKKLGHISALRYEGADSKRSPIPPMACSGKLLEY